ncbi:hypothetical protein [Paenibacillus sp. FSL W8-0194]|uniref:hypothetical protein n=1 Tax=Paenibacillus sp. FSL W8-0194 TaxID=2921711 RepID=UPI0030D7AA9F
MLALSRFMLKSYTRKHAYFAPLAATLIAMFLLYTYKPNPVMDSYAVTSAFLFVGSAWIALTFLNHGTPQQEQLHIIHAGSMKRYLLSQMLALLVPVALCTVLFVLYPLAAQMFDRSVRMGELFLAAAAHLIMGMLGTALAMFFQSAWMPNGTRATALLLVLVVASLGAKSIVGLLPEQLGWLRWFFPPVSLMLDRLLDSGVAPLHKLWGILGYGLVYALLLGLVYVLVSVRRDART